MALNAHLIVIVCSVSILFADQVHSSDLVHEANTALFEATKERDIQLMQAEIDAGASPNFLNSNGDSPMRVATIFLCIECLELLIKNGGM